MKQKHECKLMNMRLNVIKLVLSPKATKQVLLAMWQAFEQTKK